MFFCYQTALKFLLQVAGKILVYVLWFANTYLYLIFLLLLACFPDVNSYMKLSNYHSSVLNKNNYLYIEVRLNYLYTEV